MTYHVYITGWYHPKNEHSLFASIGLLGWKRVFTIEEADFVFSGDTYIDTDKYPSKKFIFGPHFSIFPSETTSRLSNTHKNSVYIVPSTESITIWRDELGYSSLPMKTLAFGIDTERFKPRLSKKKEIFVYFKRRSHDELSFLSNFLYKKGVPYTLIEYGKYTENEYINLLDSSLYGIWLGSHESQGFALQEALSMNVPLLVWSTRFMHQEEGSYNEYKHIKSKCTTVPFWDSRCGYVFYNEADLSDSFNIFISNFSSYKPREFVIENLSIKASTERIRELSEEI